MSWLLALNGTLAPTSVSLTQFEGYGDVSVKKLVPFGTGGHGIKDARRSVTPPTNRRFGTGIGTERQDQPGSVKPAAVKAAFIFWSLSGGSGATGERLGPIDMPSR